MTESFDTSKPDKKGEKPSKTKAGREVASVFGKALEAPKRAETADKLTGSAGLFERLIPKDGGLKSKERSEAGPASTEEIVDPGVENLTASEKVEVTKDYAESKVGELVAGRSETEDPAEAAAREANIKFLLEVQSSAETTLHEPTEQLPEQSLATEVSEGPAELGLVTEGPTEFAHDEAIHLNASESTAVEPLQPTTLSPLHSGNSGGSNLPPPLMRSVGGPISLSPGFNSAPTGGLNPNLAPKPVESITNQSSEGSYFLAGGILGYMLGRRRGRIKTERRLKVVSDTLEKQIDDTRQQVIRQETVVRAQARQRYNEAHRPRNNETMPTVVKRPEANTKRREVTPVQAMAAERVQRMEQQELLAVAEKIVIGGTSLRTIYEAKQITEPGLRRLTREYMRGGDLKAALQAELKVKEMQYERDPQMRDRLAASYAGVDAAQPQTSSDGVVALFAQDATPKAAAMHKRVEQAAAEAELIKQNRGKQALLAAWAVLVFVLVIVAVVLATR